MIDVLIDGQRYDIASILGGVIRVGTELFALTTAHSFRILPPAFMDYKGRIIMQGKRTLEITLIVLLTVSRPSSYRSD